MTENKQIHGTCGDQHHLPDQVRQNANFLLQLQTEKQQTDQCQPGTVQEEPLKL